MDYNLSESTNAKALVDEDSASTYEVSSKDEDSEGDSQDDIAPPLSRAGSQNSRISGSKKRSMKDDGTASDIETSSDPKDIIVRKLENDRAIVEKVRKDAKQWAANFVPPQSPGHIKSPPRQEAGSRKRKQRDQLPCLSSRTRAKRFKSFYSDEFRELLNSEIEDASAMGKVTGQSVLLNSQIGASIWTSKDKDVFFSALASLGRDNAVGIALRVGSKSELEVQEYVHLLHEGLKLRIEGGSRKQTLPFIDLPAAFEISEECCGVLERAADALSTRQDCYEIEKEKSKWSGDSWLLTKKLSRAIHQQRRDEDEEAEIETLPAVNLFNLKMWLQLSREIFMNSGAAFGADNWKSLAEPGELPAIRTTAFEDFYSLTLSLMKRLISTTLFCTMSRQRARHSKLLKHADVTKEDVESAVKMLGLQVNSNDFWVKCARRCNLEVIDNDESEIEGEIAMTYDEVELAIANESTSSTHYYPPTENKQRENLTGSPKDIINSEELTYSHSDSHSDTEHSLSDESWHSVVVDQSDEELGSRSSNARREKSRQRMIEKKKESLQTQENYTEAFDMRESRVEEARLWSMLHQTAPFGFQPEALPTLPRFSKNKPDDISIWRENTEFWSSWEMLSTPVPSRDFVKNREVKSNKAKRKQRKAAKNESGEDISEEDDVELSVDGNSVVERSDQEHETDKQDFHEKYDHRMTNAEIDSFVQLSEESEGRTEDQVFVENRFPSPEQQMSESP